MGVQLFDSIGHTIFIGKFDEKNVFAKYFKNSTERTYFDVFTRQRLC